MNRDEAQIQLMKRADELGFKIVGLMDCYDEASKDGLLVTNVKRKYGINVSNGVLPLSVFTQLMDKKDA